MDTVTILHDNFFANPYPRLAELRKNSPCWYDLRLDAYIVTRYHDIEHVLQDERFSAERVRQFGRGAPEHAKDQLEIATQELERWLLFRDPPDHTRLRGRLSRAISSHLLPDVRRLAARAVEKSLSSIAWTDTPDIVRDLAYPVPTQILAELLGVETADIARFKQWTTDIFALIGAGIADDTAIELGYRGVIGLHDYAINLLEERRRRPRADLLSVLGDRMPEEDGSLIEDDDIVGLFMTTIVAGHETTSNLIANAAHAIMTTPTARQWVLEHRGITEGAVDELARFDGPVLSLIRRAKQDLSIAGQRVKQGDCVFSVLNAGNRDPRKFPNPDKLDFERPRPTHFGFGVGMHGCLGAMIARAVVAESISGLFMRYPDIAEVPGAAWQRNMSIRGLSALPVQLGESSLRRNCRAFVSTLTAASPGASDIEVELPAHPLSDLAENPRRQVDAIVHASTIEAVRRVVRESSERGVSIYPITTGMNWGLGSRSPIMDGGILLSLARMNRIRELDLELGIAVIEPGVTQADLADRLVDTPYFLNVTTSCKDSSVLGNALDRGQGMVRMRIDELLGLEVVLDDGSLIKTGGIGPSDERRYHGLGAGPDATRIFPQSNFGVVTAGAISLVPRPEATGFAYATFASEAMPRVIECLGKLRRERVLESIAYLSEMQFAAGSELSDFTVLGPVLGRRRIVDEQLAIIREELGGLRGCKAFRTGEVRELEPGDPLYHRGRMFLGIPTCESLRARFGTKTCKLDEEATRGWSVLQTLLPFDAQAVNAALEVVGEAAAAHRLTIQPHISSVGPTSLNLMNMIWFGRSGGDLLRLRALRESLHARLTALGFHPSRLGIDLLHAGRVRQSDDPLLSRLKSALDSQERFAPGRYV